MTGAPSPVTVDGREVGPYSVLSVRPGEVLRLGVPPHGLRSYVAVRGGVEVPAVLGSRSHDVLAGIGPAPLAEGDELPGGEPPAGFPGVDVLPPPRFDDDVLLTVVRGPRDEWVRRRGGPGAGRLDRLRREQPGRHAAHRRRPEHRDPDRQLRSEGACRGAIQVPPSGEPVLFLADHPVTGGYPVVAVVVDADVDRAAQVRPGQRCGSVERDRRSDDESEQPARCSAGRTPEAGRCSARGWSTQTSGWSRGWAQANLIALPRELAFDFLLFAQRNPKPCPILDVLDAGATSGPLLAGDIRTDLPAYRVYVDGELVEETPDARSWWREDLVSFLVGCSFTFEAALQEAGVAVRHIDRRQRADVPHHPALPVRRPVLRAAGGLDAPGAGRRRSPTRCGSRRATRRCTARRCTWATRGHWASRTSAGPTTATRSTCGRGRCRCSGAAG